MEYCDVIDIESAKERFMGNYGLFSKYLFQFPERSLHADLKETLEQNDVKRSFELAHTMKGIAANLSLKLLENPLHTVVENLRAGNLPGAAEIQLFDEAYASTIETIERIQKEGAPLF